MTDTGVLYQPMMVIIYNLYINIILVNDRHNCIIPANDGNDTHHIHTRTLVK